VISLYDRSESSLFKGGLNQTHEQGCCEEGAQEAVEVNVNQKKSKPTIAKKNTLSKQEWGGDRLSSKCRSDDRAFQT